MRNNGQAAMEFLLTYGWAIVIVLITVGALSYFGVLSPQNIAPERTMFSDPIANIDNAVLDITGHTIDIAYQNNKGVPITVLRSTTFDSAKCTGGIIQNVTDFNHTEILPNQHIQNGQRFIIRWTCDPGMAKPGDKISADVTFDYKNSETGQTLKETGIIDGKWT